ncbi:sensor histidine kinase [Nocardioides alcanivorans]|uniref:sensor histidine kinase n=1 Tax=Nocardioides alcanivorans TaxID=2897352 RepID=UPI001F485C7A|nr:HAMP domain-containing sensor histidine kinase [Nocardioides alcanivorans]
MDCPIHDARGRLIGCLQIDAPGDGKVPGPERHAFLNLVASLASAAILAIIERGEARRRLRLLDAVRAAGTPSTGALFADTVRAATAALRDGVVADRVAVAWFEPGLEPERAVSTPGEQHAPTWPDSVIDRSQVSDLWCHDEAWRVPPYQGADGAVHDGLLVVPIGTDRSCLGAVVLERSSIRAPWVRAEVRGAREFAAALARAAQGHLERREEQELVDELRETVAEHSRVAAGVRHDLAAPLGAIRNYLDLLTTAEDNPQLHQRILQGLRVGASEVQEVAQVLSVFRNHSEQEEVIDIVTLLRETVELYTAQAENAGVGFTLDVEPGTVALVAGPSTSLRRILSNLTSNAVKYTLAGGRVTIIARHASSGAVTLEWRDTGIGMAEEDLARLWDDFYRSPDPRVRARPGAGIGLPIVAQLLDEVGGQIEITSTLDAGTTARVELPTV